MEEHEKWRGNGGEDKAKGKENDKVEWKRGEIEEWGRRWKGQERKEK